MDVGPAERRRHREARWASAPDLHGRTRRSRSATSGATVEDMAERVRRVRRRRRPPSRGVRHPRDRPQRPRALRGAPRGDRGAHARTSRAPSPASCSRWCSAAPAINARIGRPAAGKTGTVDDNTDAWFVGYTPELVAAAWVGFPDGGVKMRPPQTRITVIGGTFPAQIWQIFASSALASIPGVHLPRARSDEHHHDPRSSTTTRSIAPGIYSVVGLHVLAAVQALAAGRLPGQGGARPEPALPAELRDRPGPARRQRGPARRDHHAHGRERPAPAWSRSRTSSGSPADQAVAAIRAAGPRARPRGRSCSRHRCPPTVRARSGSRARCRAPASTRARPSRSTPTRDPARASPRAAHASYSTHPAIASRTRRASPASNREVMLGSSATSRRKLFASSTPTTACVDGHDVGVAGRGIEQRELAEPLPGPSVTTFRPLRHDLRLPSSST